MILDDSHQAILNYIRRAGALNVSHRAVDDLAAHVGLDNKQVMEHLNTLQSAGLLARQDADGPTDPVTGHKPTLLRLTLADERATAKPSTG